MEQKTCDLVNDRLRDQRIDHHLVREYLSAQLGMGRYVIGGRDITFHHIDRKLLSNYKRRRLGGRKDLLKKRGAYHVT